MRFIAARYGSPISQTETLFLLTDSEIVEGQPIRAYFAKREDVKKSFETGFLDYGLRDRDFDYLVAAVQVVEEYGPSGVLYIRIGCQHFFGEDAKLLRDWANELQEEVDEAHHSTE